MQKQAVSLTHMEEYLSPHGKLIQYIDRLNKKQVKDENQQENDLE